MKKYLQISILVFAIICCTYCKKQSQTGSTEKVVEPIKDSVSVSGKVDTLFMAEAPNRITRTIIQDKKGDIWFASFDGVIRYDGKSFENISNEVTPSRFFSVLEDQKGNFWFASIGSGVYYYDGTSFQNFTTKEGLASDRVTYIYEDTAQHIWFGTESGASRFDGKNFKNFTKEEGLPHNEVNSILEDPTGKIWMATRDGVTIYDGNTFLPFTKEDGTSFKNVRSMIQDQNNDLWIGGSEGLWHYNGSTFTQINKDFVGYIYEDQDGNIWTGSAENADSFNWIVSCYKEKALVKEIETQERLIFGILEDDKRNLWVGTFDGIFKYDGHSRTYYNSRF